MRTFSSISFSTTSIAALLIASACGEAKQGNNPIIAVTVQGVTSAYGTGELEVVKPGTYSLIANGAVDNGLARIDIDAVDAAGDIAGSLMIMLPASEAGALDDDIGSGFATADAEVDGVANASIDFTWEAVTPETGWNIGVDFEHNPNIDSWSVSPAPLLGSNDTFYTSIEASTPVGDVSDLTAFIQFGTDTPIELTYDINAGAFFAQGTTPATPGATVLTAIVRNSANGLETLHPKLVFIGNGGLQNVRLNAPGDSVTITPTPGGYRVRVTSGGVAVQGAEVTVWEAGNPNNRTNSTTDAAGNSNNNLNGRPDKVHVHVQWQDANGQWHVIMR